MDGYVFRHQSLKKNNNKVKLFGKILAGHPVDSNKTSNVCFKIMTGGMIPKGFDTVIPQELVKIDNDLICFDFQPKKGANIRKTGEDISKNEVALKKGTYINPLHIGLLASLGISQIKVFEHLKIGFFSTGDEVVQLGKKIKPGQVYDSNRYLIKSFIHKMNLHFNDYGNLSDNKSKLEKQLKKASEENDLIITTGGVSVGEADYMKEVLSNIGKVLFWKMSIKPGRPMAFGKIKKSFYFGLPGNPVSAAVTFLQFVKPSIKLMMGNSRFEPTPTLEAKLGQKIIRKKGRTEFIRAHLEKTVKGYHVKPLTQQGSGMLKSMSDANCFIFMAEKEEVLEKNSSVKVILFDGLI
jgi:molybdopterin molybdotransferase